MTSPRDERTLRRLWALREDVAVESDDHDLVLLAPWGEISLGARGLRVESQLRRLALGPVDLGNTDPDGMAELADVLAGVSGAVVHSLELPGRQRAGLSAVPIAAVAPFAPAPADPRAIVRLSRFAVIRPWAGRFVVNAPGARHELVCEGPALGAILARLATGRQVSDLSGRSDVESVSGAPCLDGATAQDVEDVIGWLIAIGVVVVARPDGCYDEDLDPGLSTWSAHELEFEARTRRPGGPVEERFRLREGSRAGPVTRAPYAGPVRALPRGPQAEGPLDTVLAPHYEAPAFTGAPLPAERLGALLHRAARLRAHRPPSVREDSPGVETTQRPYLSTAWLYELEIYLALDRADLPRGVYHYDPEGHALRAVAPAPAVTDVVRACLAQIGAQPSSPAAVVLVTCRRERSAWALGSLTHATGIAHAGALQQVLHLVGRDTGVATHPVPLGAAEGWQTLLDALWPGEVPVGVCVLDPVMDPIVNT
ncbi:SagB/ThcOx family dehydrogenase [Actinomycetospora aeridis]|uniref:SagB/ThcOx family dehydrogenase n=1 Tax=Actinomycetospora aeridis TaxID=3129231 RepID=A0ABU8N090_9PSEU